MSQEAKIVGYKGNNVFEIELKPEEEKNLMPSIDKVKIMHDYVQFEGRSSFQMDRNKDGDYPYKTKGAVCNWVKSRASVQISIRDMIKIVLPLLKNHKYLQEEHIADRIHTEDGITYKKGDTYPGYAYDAGIIQYYDRNRKETMVSFRRAGEKNHETVTLSLFNQIKDTLKLYKTKKDLEKS